MRRLFLVLALGLMSCTTQPVGARCQQDLDCNGDNSEVCRNELNPMNACNSAASCVCCPSDRALALTIPACVPHSSGVDAGVTTDVVMSVSDAADASDVAADLDVRDASADARDASAVDAPDVTATDVTTDATTDVTATDATAADAAKGDAVSDGGGAG